MKCVQQVVYKRDWVVIKGTSRSQAAFMAIPPGKSEGGPDNEHAADQWLYVMEGRALAIVNGKKIPLKKNGLLLIKAGEKHQIQNISRTKLKTINFYSPPVFG